MHFVVLFTNNRCRYMNKLGKNEGVLNRRIVGIGAMDENWGWLSSHFVNRTVTWYSYFYIQPYVFEVFFLFFFIS